MSLWNSWCFLIKSPDDLCRGLQFLGFCIAGWLTVQYNKDNAFSWGKIRMVSFPTTIQDWGFLNFGIHPDPLALPPGDLGQQGSQCENEVHATCYSVSNKPLCLYPKRHMSSSTIKEMLYTTSYVHLGFGLECKIR